MSAWRQVVKAFRDEFGGNHRAVTGGRRRGGGTAPRCPCCELFVRAMCQAPYEPCGVCVRCCPGGHKPPPPPRDAA